MKLRELRECMTQLADHYGLRWSEKRKCFLGIHRGILLEVAEWDGEIGLKFSSPTGNIGDEILEGFAGFTCFKEEGLPTAWIKGLIEVDARGHEKASNHACAVCIDTHRLENVGVDKFMEIPHLIAEDFHGHGAVQALPCANCGQKEATALALLNYAYSPLCDACWQAIQEQATGGSIQTVQEVNWRGASVILVGVMVAGAILWGLLQEVESRLERGLGIVLFILAFLWGVCVCGLVPRFSGGVTLALRVCIALAVLLGLLLGNAWGYYALLRQQAPQVTFSEAIDLYFRVQLGLHLENELPYLACGGLGAWIGFALLKSFGRITVQ